MSIFKKIWNVVDNFFYEEVEEEEPQKDELEEAIKQITPEQVVQEIKQPEVKTQVKAVDEQVEKENVKKEEVIEEKPVKNVTSSTFVNVEQLAKPTPTIEKVELKKPQYRMQTVISPIFGAQDNNSINYSTSNIKIDNDEVIQKSYIGTVISPITGNQLYQEVDVEDTIDQKIAEMNVNDFISVNNEEEKMAEPSSVNIFEEEIIDAKFVTGQQPVIKPVIEIPNPAKQETKIKNGFVEFDMPIIQPIIEPYEKEENTQMSLFDQE